MRVFRGNAEAARGRSWFTAPGRRPGGPLLDRGAVDSSFSGAAERTPRFSQGLVGSTARSPDCRRAGCHTRQARGTLVPRVARRESRAFSRRLRLALSRAAGGDAHGVRERIALAPRLPLVAGDGSLGLGGVSSARLHLRRRLQSRIQTEISHTALLVQARD